MQPSIPAHRAPFDAELKFREKPLLLAILASWLIALPEYALQVPANRWGYGTFTATQLKVIQEAISLGVFVVFAWLYLGEPPGWRVGVAGVLIVAAVALIRSGPDAHKPDAGAPVTEVRKEAPKADPGREQPIAP